MSVFFIPQAAQDVLPRRPCQSGQVVLGDGVNAACAGMVVDDDGSGIAVIAPMNRAMAVQDEDGGQIGFDDDAAFAFVFDGRGGNGDAAVS